MKQYEEWIDCFADVIPYSEFYTMKLESGEENGLLIYLEDKRFEVFIDFGVVYAVNVCDEGLLMNLELYDHESKFNLFDKKSTIYKINNGCYTNAISMILGPEMFDFYKLNQYNILTMNYLVSVLSKDSPLIQVRKKA